MTPAERSNAAFWTLLAVSGVATAYALAKPKLERPLVLTGLTALALAVGASHQEYVEKTKFPV